MVTPLALSSLPVGCVKDVPCSPFCMFSPWKCWLLTSAVILILLVFVSLVLLVPSLYCSCMLLTRLPFRAMIAPLERSSRFMAVSNKALVPSLILVNGRVFGRLDAPVPIKWTTTFIKVLGVYLGNGNLEEENWRP